ncbi:MAG: helix-turn-helix transcriptional regulator [Chloroflexi bacterium]|nr:helix-turn-helix transcriptional regulator [Chloroflexota bacterium]
MSPATSKLGQLVRTLRQRVGLSQHELARRAGMDVAYVNRIEAAPAERPVVPRDRLLGLLASALALTTWEIDRLYVAAGRCPPSVASLGDWDPALGALCRVLSDPALTADDLAEFRFVLETLASRWRRGEA